MLQPGRTSKGNTTLPCLQSGKSFFTSQQIIQRILSAIADYEFKE
jgi:hypothetical protein